MSQKNALLIGLNSIDPNHYDGSTGKLNFPEKDVSSMWVLLDAMGFSNIQMLKTPMATRENVLNALAEMAQQTDEGGLMVVYYSGHGGLVPDQNGDEAQDDQTWCLYNGQLLDDELWQAWSKFKKGSRILFLSDSCHSGSMARVIGNDTKHLEDAIVNGAKLLLPSIFKGIYAKNQDFYQKIVGSTPDWNTIAVEASLISITACEDGELAYEDRKLGQSHFTYQLLAAWDKGNFKGSHTAFYETILKRITMPQMPQLQFYGTDDLNFRSSNPFTVEAPLAERTNNEAPQNRPAELLVTFANSNNLQKTISDHADWVAQEQYGNVSIDRYAAKDIASHNAWDMAHALLDELRDKGGEVSFIEPNLENVSDLRETPESPKADDEDAPTGLFLSTWPYPKKNFRAHFAWHLDGDHTTLAAARDALMQDAALMESLKEKPIRIAHIDTGYLDIPLFKPKGLRTDLAKNFAGDNSEGDDPDRYFSLIPEQQGHGAATLAILAGPEVASPKGMEGFTGYLGGIPLAEIIPIRIEDSVALFKTNAFAKAVEYAIQQGCEVITMSMAGAPSKAWDDVVNEAYSRGITIVSAAGNSWREGARKRLPKYLLYPARFARVIGATGVTHNQQPYLFDQNSWEEMQPKSPGGVNMQGNHGPDHEMWHVLSAYTPNVFWAESGPKVNDAYPDPYFTMTGGGTSSATPQIAAAAALWIAKYRKELKPYAGTWKQVEAVRYALFKSAEKFDNNTGSIATADDKKGKLYSYLGQGALRAANALEIPPPIEDDLKISPPAKTPSFPLFRTLHGGLKSKSQGIVPDDAPVDEVRAQMLSLELLQVIHFEPNLVQFGEKALEDEGWLEVLSGEEKSVLKNAVKGSTFASEALKEAVELVVK